MSLLSLARLSRNLVGKSTGVSIAIISVVAFLLMIHHFDHEAPYKVGILDMIEKHEFFDKDGSIVEGSLLAPPAEAVRAKFYLSYDLRKNEGDSLVFHIKPVQAPVTLKSGERIIATFGDHHTKIPPRLPEVFISLDKPADHLVLEMTFVKILTGMQTTFLRGSGIGSKSEITLKGFIHKLIINFGFLGMSFVFLAIAFLLFLFNINNSSKIGIPFLVGSTLVFSWIALYFSRMLYEITEAPLHSINYILLPLADGLFCMFLAYHIKTKYFHVMSRFFLLVSVSMSVLLTLSNQWNDLSDTMKVYAVCLLLIAGKWTAMGIFASFYTIRTKEKQKFIYLTTATWTVGIGMFNDVARVFRQDLILFNVSPYLYFVALSLLLVFILTILRKQREDMRAKEHLFIKNQAIAATTQILAHDVRRPFSMLDSLLAMLMMDMPPERKNKLISKLAPEIKKASKDVNELIQDIMMFGQKQTLMLESAELPQLLMGSVHNLMSYGRNSNVKVTYDLEYQGKIGVDQLKFGRAIGNILSNAFEAMASKGEVNISSSLVGEKVEIKIANTGSVIPEDKLETIFQPFYTKGKRGGTGLGLAIVKQIVEAHEGEVFCESSQKETAFIFRLPLSA